MCKVAQNDGKGCGRGVLASVLNKLGSGDKIEYNDSDDQNQG